MEMDARTYYRCLQAQIELMDEIAKSRKNKIQEEEEGCIITQPGLFSSDRLCKAYSYVHVNSYDLRINPEHINIFYALCDKVEDYGFKSIQSATPKFYGNLTPPHIQYLERVDLYDHTLNVFDIAVERIETIPLQYRYLGLVLALIHDFGKSPRIKQEVESLNITTEPITMHAHISGYYLLSPELWYEGKISDDIMRAFIDLKDALYAFDKRFEFEDHQNNVYSKFLIECHDICLEREYDRINSLLL